MSSTSYMRVFAGRLVTVYGTIRGIESRIRCGRAGTEGRPAKGNRLFVEAVLYRYRAGVPWRDLPERFGDFRGVPLRFTR